MRLLPASRGARVAGAAVVIVAALLGLAWGARDAVLKSLIVRNARTALRTSVTLDRVQTGVFPLSLRITGLAVGNPEGYPSGDAFRVNEFYIRLAPRAFKGPTNEIAEIRLDVSNVTVISRADGRNNFSDLFDPVMTGTETSGIIPDSTGGKGAAPLGEPAVVEPAPETGGGTVVEAPDVNEQVEEVIREYAGEKPFRIGSMTLRVGVVDIQTERDDQKGPKVQHIEVNGEHTLRNVTDLEAAQREMGSAMLIQALPSLLHDAMKDK